MITTRSALQVLVRELRRCGGQPAVGDHLAQRGRGGGPHLDQHGSVAVEVRDGEECARVRGEDGFLLAEIRDADGEDRAVRRGLVAEPPDVRLAERPLPRECLARDEPGPVPLPFTHGDLGQVHGHPGGVVDSRHGGTLRRGPARSERLSPGGEEDSMASTALLIMDVQQDIVARFAGDDGYLDRLATAITAARAAGVMVGYVTIAFRPGYPEVSDRNKSFAAIAGSGRFTDGDPGTQIPAAVAPAPGEAVVIKRRVSAFAGSDLDVLL